MGTYFNPDNGSFKQAVRSFIYVDKTELIEWEPHTRDFSHELGDQTSQRI